MLTFSHAGRFGDILYSLYFATHYAHGQQFDLILRTGVEAYDPSGRPHMMEVEDAEWMTPLLKAQPYINDVRIARTRGELPCNRVRLDVFRRNMGRICKMEIRSWYYDNGRVPSGEFHRQVLTVPPVEKTDRIAICFTPRYRQTFDLSPLKQYREKLVFVGLQAEHDAFCRDVIPCDYKPCQNALEMLSFMALCRGFIGNVSGTFAMAECSKIPRILCVAPNRGNVRVYGNGYEANTTTELEMTLKQLLGEKQ